MKVGEAMEAKPSLLIVEDDASFARALRRSFERRGYDVSVCGKIDGMSELLETISPQFAIVDLKLSGTSGLECVKILHRRDPTTKIVVLTGFASIATAVGTIQLGAGPHLAQASNSHDKKAAFGKGARSNPRPPAERPTPIKKLQRGRIPETP